MKRGGIIYLPTARKQLEDIVDYIAVELAAPDAALDFIEEVGKATKSLAEMPYRHPIYHTSFALLEEVRWISVKNYNVFYKIFEIAIEKSGGLENTEFSRPPDFLGQHMGPFLLSITVRVAY